MNDREGKVGGLEQVGIEDEQIKNKHCGEAESNARVGEWCTFTL